MFLYSYLLVSSTKLSMIDWLITREKQSKGVSLSGKVGPTGSEKAKGSGLMSVSESTVCQGNSTTVGRLCPGLPPLRLCGSITAVCGSLTAVCGSLAPASSSSIAPVSCPDEVDPKIIYIQLNNFYHYLYYISVACLLSESDSWGSKNSGSSSISDSSEESNMSTTSCVVRAIACVVRAIACVVLSVESDAFLW